MRIIIWFSVFASLAILAFLIELSYSKREKEHFIINRLEDDIINTYKALLEREPTGLELKAVKYKIQNGMTFEELKNRLIQTDEYSRLIKSQSNSLTPELMKMMSDEYILNRVTEIYKKELNKEIAKKHLYPLKDIYVDILDHNEIAFSAMLRDPKYKLFEDEIGYPVDLNYDKLVDIFDKYYDKMQLLNTIKTTAQVEYRSVNEADTLLTSKIFNIADIK